jgi:5'-nucleotidase / UDP-sugar diphosphatase
VKLEVTGATLLAALENGVSEVDKVSGRFPQVSGMRFTYDPERAPGQRVLKVEVGGKPLDPAATYSLATSDFIAEGGDGYAMLKPAKRLLNARDARLTANDVMVYIRERGEVAPAVEGRIVRAQ